MIVGIVPPTVKNGKRGGEPDIDAYLEVFVDELIQMGDTSLLLSHKRAPLDVKVRLVLFLLDFPGMAKVFHQNQQNAYRCCPTCKHEGCQIAPLNKMTYMESRRFLPQDHPLRSDRVLFPGLSVERRGPPERHTNEEQEGWRKTYDNLADKEKIEWARETGIKGTHPFSRYPNHDGIESRCPDPMHCCDVVVSKILYYLGRLPEDLQAKERLAHRLLRTRMNRDSSLNVENADEGVLCFLTQEQIDAVHNRVEFLQFPRRYDGVKGKILTDHVFFKTAQRHEYTQSQAWIWLLRGQLPWRQFRTFTLFFAVLARFTVKSFEPGYAEWLEPLFHLAISLFERDFPIGLNVSQLHQFHHLSENLGLLGPTHGWSMWLKKAGQQKFG
jgi:hypothetical protein